MSGEVAGVDRAGVETRAGGDGAEEVEVGLDAGEFVAGEGRAELGQGFGAGGGVDDQFGEHGVVVDRDGVALADAGVDPGGGTGLAQVVDDASAGAIVAGGVFGVEADFDGVAVDLEVLLAEREGFAGGDAELPLDEVLAGDGLGDGVFDLEAGVHLHEVEFVIRRFVRDASIDDEFDGAGAFVADGAGGGAGGLAHGGAAGRGHAGGGGFLHDLLVAALDGAVALEEVECVAVAVGEDLKFDVTGSGEIALEEDAIVAEGGAGFALG